MLFNKFSEKIEVGCDESGRGCLAGPVVAAAVLLPPNFKNKDINDSKKINEKKREILSDLIISKAISYGIGISTVEEIDKMNILNASLLAMHRAIDCIKENYEILLIDGNKFNPYKDIEHKCIIKGDSKYQSIAAASILAKTTRDKIMIKIDKEFPEYHWKRNKGYATKKHRSAIIINGTNIHHRKSFQLTKNQFELF